MGQISANVTSGPYLADGVQTVFPITFSMVATTNVQVLIDGSAASPTLYSVAIISDNAGTVTFHAPPADGAQILLVSNPDFTQTSNFNDQGAYNLATVNLINRRATIRDLVLKDRTDRSPKLPQGENAPQLPSLADGDGHVLGMANGKFVWVPNDSVAMAGDLADAQAAADTALGAAAQTGADVEATAAALSVLPTRYSKVEDTTRTATTTLAADPDLQFALPAHALISFKGKIFYTTTDPADFKWRHTGPASPDLVCIERQAIAPGATAKSGIAVDTTYSSGDISITGAAGTGLIEIDGLIKNGATAGIFGISWAQDTSDAGNTIVRQGSYLEAATLSVPVVIQFSDNAIAKLGQFGTFYGSRSAGLAGGDIGNSWVEFIASGYKLQAVMYGNGSNCTLIIDGIPQVLTPPAGWNTVTLFDGITDGAHRVKIGGATGTSNACAFDAANTFTIYSHAVPSIARPADISNYFFIGGTTFTSYGALDTTPVYGGGFGNPEHPYTWGSDGFGMRFQSTTDQVQIFAYGYGGEQFVLLKDGVQVGAPFVMPNDGIWGIRTLATGLTGTHEYEIIQIVAGKISTVLAVLCSNIEPVAHPVRDLDVWYGDSIVVESVLTDVRQGEAWIVAHAGGRAAHRVGTGGAKASTFGRDNTALVTGLAQAPVKIFECFGVNDMQLGVSIPTFQADVQAMLTSLRAGCPSAKIYCRGILPVASSVSNYSQRSAYNAAKAAAVAAIGDSNIVYVNTDGWLNTTTGLYDGLHPNASGYGDTSAAQLLVM